MSAALATVADLQRELPPALFDLALDLTTFIDRRKRWSAFPGCRGIARRRREIHGDDRGAISERHVGRRLNELFERGIYEPYTIVRITKRGREKELRAIRPTERCRVGLMTGRDQFRGDWWRFWRPADNALETKADPPQPDIFVGEGEASSIREVDIKPSTEASESVAAREEGFLKTDSGILAGIDASASTEADRPPHSTVDGIERPNLEPSSEPAPSDDPPAAATPPEGLPHAAVNPPGRRGFVPFNCGRKRKSEAERRHIFELLRDQKIPRLLDQLPQGHHRVERYKVELAFARDEAAQRAIVDRYAKDFSERKYDLEPETLREWMIAHDIPVKPRPPQQEKPPPAPAATGLSVHDHYRLSAKIVEAELAARRAQR